MTRDEWARRPGRSSTSWIRRSTRIAIYARDNFACVYCNRPCTGIIVLTAIRQLTLDHVVPRCDGGSNHPSNLVTACVRCNTTRQDRRLRGEPLRRARAATRRVLNRKLGRALAAEENRAKKENQSLGSDRESEIIRPGEHAVPGGARGAQEADRAQRSAGEPVAP